MCIAGYIARSSSPPGATSSPAIPSPRDGSDDGWRPVRAGGGAGRGALGDARAQRADRPGERRRRRRGSTTSARPTASRRSSPRVATGRCGSRAAATTGSGGSPSTARRARSQLAGGQRAVRDRRRPRSRALVHDDGLGARRAHHAPTGEIEEFPAPGMPSMITDGPDGALWFTLNQGNAIGRIDTRRPRSPRAGSRRPTPARSGSPPPTTARCGSRRSSPTSSGRIPEDGPIEELPLPEGSKPHAVIAAQSDGVWVSLWGANAIAHVSGDGEFAQIDLPPGSASRTGSRSGPTGTSGWRWSAARSAGSTASSDAGSRRLSRRWSRRRCLRSWPARRRR